MPFSNIIIYIDLWGMMALKSRCLWEQDGVVWCKMYNNTINFIYNAPVPVLKKKKKKKHELQAQYSFTYQAQYMAKKYMQ